MTRLTPDQIAQAAAGAGFTGDGLVRAVAVALAESGGQTAAVGVNGDRWRSRDRGLWQINSHWHPEVSDAEAFNPNTAARHAYRISRAGTDWSPWATWPVAASVHLGRARLAASRVRGGVVPALRPGIPFVPPSDLIPGLPDSDGSKGPLAGLGQVPEAAASVVDVARQAVTMAIHAGAWVADSHNWGRVAMVTGGTLGVLLGLKLLADTGAAGSTARAVSGINPVKAAAQVVPVGKALKAVK